MKMSLWITDVPPTLTSYPSQKNFLNIMSVDHSTILSQLEQRVHERFPDLDCHEFRGDKMLTVPADKLVEVMRYLKEACGFDMLLCVSAVDHMDADPRFEVHYTITQAESGVNLLVRVPAPGMSPSVPSLVPLWRSANWLEREQFDLMGVKFEGHPDLRRIMMWEDYPFHPLRKDFPVAGVETETPGVAFTEKAPTSGVPFVTAPGGRTAAEREPRSRS